MIKPPGTVLLVLNWAPSAQGGVTGVVQQLLANWGDDSRLHARMTVNEWSARTPVDKNDACYFRFSLIDDTRIIRTLKSILQAPIALYRTARFLRSQGIVAVNFHYPEMTPLSVAILKLMRIYSGRLILSYHGTDVRPPKNWLEQLLRPVIFYASDAIVSCSNGLADRLSGTFGLKRDCISTIYNGVNTKLFSPTASDTTSLDEALPDRYILCVGSFIPRKAHDVALRAFARMADSFPDLHLCIAGGEGPCLEDLQTQAASLQLLDRVHFFVGLDPAAVAHALAKAAIFVQPSHAESFPLSVLEAGAVGVPIVASQISGHDEMIFDGETGRLFPDSDDETCAAIITELLSDPAKAHAMSRVFQRRVISEFTWDQCVRQYKSHYAD